MKKDDLIKQVKDFTRQMRDQGVDVKLDVTATETKLGKLSSEDSFVTFSPKIIIELKPHLEDHWNFWNENK